MRDPTGIIVKRSKHINFNWKDSAQFFRGKFYVTITKIILKSKEASDNVLSDTRSDLQLIKNEHLFQPHAFEIKNNISKI